MTCMWCGAEDMLIHEAETPAEPTVAECPECGNLEDIS